MRPRRGTGPGVALPLALLLAVAACATLPPAGRSFEIEGEGTLIVALPRSWQVELGDQPPADLAILFVAPTGEQLLLSVFRKRTSQPEFNAGPQVREVVARAGATQLPGAVEPELKLLQLQGTSHTGYYFALTDRALVGKTPPQDEFRVMTHGGLGVGELLLSFTLLSQERDAPAVREALAALGAATLRPRAAR
jgi:hypothetical protein